MKLLTFITKVCVFTFLVSILGCTRPSTINFINNGMNQKIGFNPKGIRFGLGVAINGRVIELGGTFLLKVDSLEVHKTIADTQQLLWKVKSNGSFSPGFIEYGKTPKRFTQVFPINDPPAVVKHNDLITTIFMYKSVKDTLYALFDENSSTVVLKTKKK